MQICRLFPLSMRFAVAALFAFAWTATSSGQDVGPLLQDNFSYRNTGPFRAGSWITDLAIPESPDRDHLYTMYVATRNGGVWKTTNNGTTFTSLFDHASVASIGAVAVAPSDAETVWVGTGDVSCARSAYYGDGVYKSTDGGATWQNMGLADSHHIARIIIHPDDPDVVFVAAMGHLFSTNEERGVFKTTDGGQTWRRVLYVDDKTGAIDLVLDRSDPDTLYAAMYECQRRPWTLIDGGSGSGIHKTTDGGETWQKLDDGLPTGQVGRIGIDLYQADPTILYAVIDNRNSRTSPAGGAQAAGGRGGRGGRGGQQGRFARPIGGEIYRSDDAGLSWRKTNSENDDASAKAGYSFNLLRIHPANPDHLFITGSSLAMSLDGGQTWGPPRGQGRGRRGGRRGAVARGAAGRGAQTSGDNAANGQPDSAWFRPFARAFGDFRTLWIDPQDPDRIIAGSDGGVYLSYDGARTCDHLLNMPLGEIYALGVDMEVPYNIYAGLQDHESWKGPSNAWSGWTGVEHWTTVGQGDGMYNQVDPTDSRWLYNNEQFGRMARVDQVERTRTIVAPTEGPAGEELRWNWTSPIHISPHASSTIYTGSQFLHRSRNRGDDWDVISPDLTTNDPEKISPRRAAIQHCTILTVSESQLTAGVIWVGTDDGQVQVTRDDGVTWTNASPALIAAGAPDDAWVSRVFASHHEAGRAYVSLSRLRQDDFRPFLYTTDDYGQSWTAIAADLPDRTINVVAEDGDNPNLLVVGNDAGVHVSLNRGASWHPLGSDMATAAVHDLVIHPREADLVIGTYGRGVWITNIAPLKELTPEALNSAAHLFAPRVEIRPREGAFGNYRWYGDRYPTTRNTGGGVTVAYYLKEQFDGRAEISITNASGETVATLNGPGGPGIQQVTWRLDATDRFDTPEGTYTAKITIGGEEISREFELAFD